MKLAFSAMKSGHEDGWLFSAITGDVSHPKTTAKFNTIRPCAKDAYGTASV